MLKKLTIFLITLSSLASIAIVKQNNINAKQENIYFTDFEGFSVSADSTVDSNTGFIWANDWQNTKTIKRNSNTLLDISLFDSNDYSIVGGFGIASNSNLAKLKNNESYVCKTYLEFTNMDKLYVEFVGDKWGSFIIDKENNILENPGGNNINDISYKNNILTFTFAMDYNTNFNVNGYIKLTGYNCKNSHVILDDVAIYRATYAMDETFEGYKEGKFDTTNASYFNNFYAKSGVKTQYVKENNNMVVKVSSDSLSTTSGEEFFFLNKLGFINKNRDYEVSFDMKVENLDALWLYYGGTWAEPHSYVEINLNNNTAKIYGEKIANFKYENNKVSFSLNTNVNFKDYKQLEFIGKAKNVTTSAITIDNVRFYQIPIIDTLSIDASNAKTNYYYGEEFDGSGLLINAIYTNGDKEKVKITDCTILYDKTKIGFQIVSITYKNVTAYLNVYVNKKLINLSINLDEIKKSYKYGEELDLTNLVVTANYESNLNEVLVHGILNNGYFIDYGGYDPYMANTYTITINYQNQKVSFNVVVEKASSITFDDVTYLPTGGK